MIFLISVSSRFSAVFLVSSNIYSGRMRWISPFGAVLRITRDFGKPIATDYIIATSTLMFLLSGLRSFCKENCNPYLECGQEKIRVFV